MKLGRLELLRPAIFDCLKTVINIQEASLLQDEVAPFRGGETAALTRMKEALSHKVGYFTEANRKTEPIPMGFQLFYIC